MASSVPTVFEAAKFGDLAGVERFVAASRDAAVAKEEDGTTPLHWAALNGHGSVVELLLAHGALIDVANQSGHTPCHWAAIGGHVKLLHRLVLGDGRDNFADPLRADLLGHTGLLHAAQYGQSLACYFFLHLDRFVAGLALPPALAARPSLSTPIAYADLEGHTVLHWAAYAGKLPTVRFLLQEGSTLTEVDKSGCTPLHWAAIKKHADVVKFLVKEGAKLDAVDADGKTAETYARDKGAKQVASFLRAASQSPAGAAAQQLSPSTWYAAGVLGAMLSGVLWITQPWFVAWPVIAGAFVALRRTLKASASKSPIFVGVFCGLYALSAIVYWTQMAVTVRAPDHPIPLWLHAVFIVVNLAFLPFYYKLIHSNPGWIVKTEQNDIRAFVADVRTSTLKPTPAVAAAAAAASPATTNAFSLCPTPNKQFCISCGVLRPLRAKHCAVTDRCVVKFDHYCGWLNNAVGHGNYRTFVAMVLAMAFIHVSFGWMSYQLATLGRDSLLLEWVDVWQTTPSFAWLTLVHAFFGFWMCGLLVSHIHQISAGFTTNEAMNRTRYWYLKAGANQTNPFAHGAVRNFREFLTGTEQDWRYLYDLPLAPSTQHV